MIKKLHATLQQWRWLPFAACNVAILAFAFFALLPLYDIISDRDAEIADKRDTLARLQSIVALEADVQAAARRPEGLLDQGEFLTGTNDGVLGADLQTRLKAIAERSGTRIRTMQGQPIRIVGPLRYIGAQLTVFGSLQSIHSTISEIETSKPYLFVTGANIKLAPPTGRGASEEPVVEAKLDVSGALPTNRESP